MFSLQEIYFNTGLEEKMDEAINGTARQWSMRKDPASCQHPMTKQSFDIHTPMDTGNTLAESIQHTFGPSPVPTGPTAYEPS